MPLQAVIQAKSHVYYRRNEWAQEGAGTAEELTLGVASCLGPKIGGSSLGSNFRPEIMVRNWGHMREVHRKYM